MSCRTSDILFIYACSSSSPSSRPLYNPFEYTQSACTIKNQEGLGTMLLSKGIYAVCLCTELLFWCAWRWHLPWIRREIRTPWRVGAGCCNQGWFWGWRRACADLNCIAWEPVVSAISGVSSSGGSSMVLYRVNQHQWRVHYPLLYNEGHSMSWIMAATLSWFSDVRLLGMYDLAALHWTFSTFWMSETSCWSQMKLQYPILSRTFVMCAFASRSFGQRRRIPFRKPSRRVPFAVMLFMCVCWWWCRSRDFLWCWYHSWYTLYRCSFHSDDVHRMALCTVEPHGPFAGPLCQAV